ncbi:MAG: hypothetical protein HS104_38535 [Polyangiaceae bacterium]|nr:hypothetical protein [Polyangiaceae bacterium]
MLIQATRYGLVQVTTNPWILGPSAASTEALAVAKSASLITSFTGNVSFTTFAAGILRAAT